MSGEIASPLASVAKIVGSTVEQVMRWWQEEVRDRWIDAGFFVERSSCFGSGASS